MPVESARSTLLSGNPPPEADSSLVTRHSSLREVSGFGLTEARNLVASPLWPRIRAFLWDFASLCDPTRLAAALSFGGSGGLPRSLSITPRLARAAEQALGLSPFFHPFPADDGSRLLLLSREDYDRLAQFLGAIALAPALRRITSGAEVRVLKAALPGIYPEALAYAAYFRRFEALFASLSGGAGDRSGGSGGSAPRPLQEAVPAVGHALLAGALSSLPSELLLRQRLRFPEGSAADAALAECSLVPGSEPANLRTCEPANGEVAAAKDAATLALKLSNPSEYHTLCS